MRPFTCPICHDEVPQAVAGHVFGGHADVLRTQPCTYLLALDAERGLPALVCTSHTIEYPCPFAGFSTTTRPLDIGTVPSPEAALANTVTAFGAARPIVQHTGDPTDGSHVIGPGCTCNPVVHPPGSVRTDPTREDLAAVRDALTDLP